MKICPTCGHPLRIAIDRDHDAFPTIEERLREAEQCLLEAGRMLAEADQRVQAAERRAELAEAQLRCLT